MCHLGMLVESGGVYKVSNIEENNKRALDAFDQAILDHKNRKKIEIPECKYFWISLVLFAHPPPMCDLGFC